VFYAQADERSHQRSMGTRQKHLKPNCAPEPAEGSIVYCGFTDSECSCSIYERPQFLKLTHTLTGISVYNYGCQRATAMLFRCAQYDGKTNFDAAPQLILTKREVVLWRVEHPIEPR
jgi:hypothetical protein